MDSGEALRVEGNRLFEAGQVAEAVALYRDSLAKERSAKTLGNLSLALLKLGSAEEALQAAEDSISVDKMYMKAYDRKANAEVALGKHWLARKTIARAIEIFRNDRSVRPFLEQRYKDLCVEGEKIDANLEKIESSEHMVEICKHMRVEGSLPASKLRLATMATFWNEATLDERMTIFVRFLQVLTGASNPIAGANFPKSMLTPLPMENYADIEVPAVWITYYKSLDAEAKVSLFEEIYAACTDLEKSLIASDLKDYFPRKDA
mmetsp:Transcript_12653/g.24537  ORF Transcript_12653/g.24537 Transcript_12653/m.24537 type:complete len:263 (+) Transcript_12653:283-1071(+)|eukprot:CAMPEP_0171486304 /NCGR_PEP_ID=MMETSP0958-20121227/1019_1 /TAXON_ID=87120 /ORGANISM="Aurantiochytrium limacinum, Strain ATCCMYA-1381" /LENGTH=262 /DNA_ID=CAMNT_0012019175 /DNA_START=273 /DNA_END=1061 /DNA_ORIENTATION=+